MYGGVIHGVLVVRFAVSLFSNVKMPVTMPFCVFLTTSMYPTSNSGANIWKGRGFFF